MSESSTRRDAAAMKWTVWLVGLGDHVRTSTGSIRMFDSLAEAQRVAAEVGGIVQVEGAPLLGGFDRALG
jgi:hypothetical protein